MRERSSARKPSVFGNQSASMESKGFGYLVAAALVTVVLWQVPGGNYILYPFTILATWFHEMGHGLAAMMLGGRFEKLLIFHDGSGVAYYAGPLFLGRIGQACVAAAGPLGPAFAGAGLIISSRKAKYASMGLTLLGLGLIASAFLLVRSFFGIIAIVCMGIVIVGIAVKGTPRLHGFVVQFLGVQACVSVFVRIDYLFSYSAGPTGISDTAQIQKALLAPYWIWGAGLAVLSLLILFVSLRIACRQ